MASPHLISVRPACSPALKPVIAYARELSRKTKAALSLGRQERYMLTPILLEMVVELIELIGNEAALFEDFLELLGRQQGMLIKNDLDGLNRIKARRRKKVVESQLLNKQREELISMIKSTNAIEGDFYVSRLIELIDKDQGNRLVQFRKIIDSLNSEISEVRSQNEVLLKRSREYVTRTLELLDKINSPNNNYNQNKATAKSKQLSD